MIKFTSTLKLILVQLFILILHNSYATDGNNLMSHNKAIKTLQLKILKTETNLVKNNIFALGSLLTWLFSSYSLYKARSSRDDWFQYPMDLYIGGYYAFTVWLCLIIKFDYDYHEKKLAFLKEQLEEAELANGQISQDGLISDQSACHS